MISAITNAIRAASASERPGTRTVSASERSAVDLQAGATAASSSSAALTGADAFRFLTELGRKLDAQDPQVARQAATQMAAELFFAPLLAEMRKFPFGRELAVGGQMESAFGAQLDQRLADTVAGSATRLLEQLVQYVDQVSPKANADPAATQRNVRGAA